MRNKTTCKTGQTSAKVRATKSRRNFSQECTRSTPLDSKLIFWCVLYYLDAFGTVWLPCKTGRTDAKVRAMKSRHNFSQRTHPIVPVGTETHVLVRFVLFGCIWYRLVALQNSVQNGLKWCKRSCHEAVSEFFATNAPDPPPLDPNLMIRCVCTIWMHLGYFGCVKIGRAHV